MWLVINSPREAGSMAGGKELNLAVQGTKG
jgi:hypothetical protein